jgi:phytoene dehydrogenase-like protein
MKKLANVFDAIVIGAGHNGLVAANYLAQANKKVLVLEQRHLVGGAALTEELIPDFKFSRCSYVLSLFRKGIIKDLGLMQKGLKIHYRDIPSLTPTKQPGQYLLFHQDSQKTRAEIAKFSQKDAEQWGNYEEYLSRFCQFWDRNLEHLPYNYLSNPSLADKINFLQRAYQPGLDYFEFGKFVTSSVREMLDNWFESDILKATLATDGIIGENLSIAHPTTAYVLLHHVMGELEDGKKGEWGYVEGGNGRLSEILAKNAVDLGATVRLNAKVEEILYDGSDSPVAVKLESGEVFESKVILSNCTNKVTFFNLIKNAEKYLPRSVYNKLKNIEYNGAATKINLALRKLPKFKAFAGHALPAEKLLKGTIHVNSHSMDLLMDAYNQTKRHRMSLTPFMDLTIPSVYDRTLCPEGYHIMNCFMQYTPYHPNSAHPLAPIPHEDIKRVFLEQINDYLEEPLDVHFMDILTPFDLEDLLGLTEGNIFHGSIGLDNLFSNRVSGKVGGVWLCGSSAHPGGGVMGAVGKQVSQRILSEKII